MATRPFKIAGITPMMFPLGGAGLIRCSIDGPRHIGSFYSFSSLLNLYPLEIKAREDKHGTYNRILFSITSHHRVIKSKVSFNYLPIFR